MRVHPFHIIRINKQLSCAGADRLSSGMRQAFGRPYGKVARLQIGQVVMSVRSKEANQKHLQEALRRAKFKFPGRQKVLLSRKMGFSSILKEDKDEEKGYSTLKREGLLRTDGCYLQRVKPAGPLEKARR